jgi:trehalose 6-phosphate phosphatase
LGLKRLTQRDLSSIDLKDWLLAFDFDGTLSPIVSHPSKARTTRSFLPWLEKLSERGALTAVITGRSLKDVKPLLRFKPDFVVGNHGMEGLEAFSTSGTRARKISRAWVKDLKSSWPDIRGAFLEDKKESLSLHYRGVRHPLKARQALMALVSQLQPKPRVIGGKCLLNLIPPGSPHKGLALKEVMRLSQRPFALFVGDDDTDEDGFRQKGPILPIRVGKKRGSAAEFYLPNQKEVGRLLRWLAKS